MWFSSAVHLSPVLRSGSPESSGALPAAMMKATAGNPVAAVMQERFGCSVANRFYQLLDDESDPFDILREADRRQQQRIKRDEVMAIRRAGLGGRRESQKELKQLGSPPAPEVSLQPVLRSSESDGEMDVDSQKRAPKQGEQQGFNNRGAEVKQDKTEWRPSFREYHSYETERSIERLDHERPIRGRGRGRAGMRGRGGGGGINRSFDGFDQRGKWEFERQSWNDKTGMEQTAPLEEAAETAEQPWASEGEPLNKVVEGEPMEEVVQEMTLDEWKNLQEQNRPKLEFNIRKPEASVPSKAVVIHKSKYSDELQKDDFEDDSHVFRKPVNDITSQLDINFGSLSRPGRGSRGAWGGCGHGRQAEETRPRPEVQLVAPNPDDPEDFPALA